MFSPTNFTNPAFANNLLLRLQSPDGVQDGILLAELQKRVNEFPSNTPPSTIAAEFDKLESRGLTLWNLATRLKRGVNGGGVGIMVCWSMWNRGQKASGIA
jgi:hypothetical protein